MTIKRLLKSGNHTCLGAMGDSDLEIIGTEMMERRVCIVYPGTFQSTEGPVEVTEENVRGLAANYNSVMMRAKRLVSGEIPLKDCAPIQSDHSELSTNTVGRLVGPLEVAQYEVPDQGVVWALFGTARILGEENCRKVKDGRWTHVSLGADLDTNKINEISITPFPAAPHAALLRKDTKMAVGAKKSYREMTDAELDLERKEVEGLVTTAEATKGAEDGTTKLLKEQLEQINGEFKKRGDKSVEMAGSGTGVPAPGSSTGMEVDDPSQPPAKAAVMAEGGDEKAKVAAIMQLMQEGKYQESLAQMKAAFEPKGEPDAKMSTPLPGDDEAPTAKNESTEAVNPVPPKDPTHLARRDRIIKLASSIKATNKSIMVEERKAKISARLSGLKASGKITPAEVKKIDLVRLSAANDLTVDAVMESYESREPVIITGIYGSANAPDVSTLVKDARKARMSRLEAESREHMISVPKGKRMSKGNTEVDDRAKEEAREHGETRMSEGYDPDHDGDDHAEMGAMIKLMEEGKHEEALAKMKTCMKCMSHAKMYGDANLTSMAAEVTKLREHCGELMKLAAESLQVPENELV